VTAARQVIAYLGVGSNIDPETNLIAALDRLRRVVRVTGVSTVYRTAPLGRPEQASYLNGVWRIETGLGARPLKYDVLRPLESALGRVRTADRDAARTIDLDVLLYGDLVVDEPGLKLPDPALGERVFLAVPLLELAPDLVLPGTNEPLRAVVRRLPSGGLVPVHKFTGRLRALLGG